MNRRLLIALPILTFSLPVHAAPTTAPATRAAVVRLFAPKSPAESLAVLHVNEGYEVELVASEPLVMDPVAIDWGPDGRLWVVEMADYPTGMDGKGKPGGRVKYLQDTQGTGKFDKATLFLDNIQMPTGIAWWRNGVLVTAAPDIFFAAASAGSAMADTRKVLYTGFKEGNPQLRINAPRWSFDGWVSCANGMSNGTPKSMQNESTLNLAGHDIRIRPDTGEMDLQSGVSQYGRDRDDLGNWFGVDNSNPLCHYVLEDQYVRRNHDIASPDSKRQLVVPRNGPVFSLSAAQKLYDRTQASPGHPGHFTSACGMTIYRDDLLFPRDGLEHSFTCEPVHSLVHHAVLREEGVSFTASRAADEQDKEFLASEDPWCRMVQVRTGPDGCLWVVDFYRYLVEHPAWLPPGGKEKMTRFFREGDTLGRIYRVYPKGHRPTGPLPRLDRLDTPALVAKLESTNGWQRDTAQQLLLNQADPAAIRPLSALAQGGASPLARIHALWTLHLMKALNPGLIEHALKDLDAAVRRQAIRLVELHSAEQPRLIDAALALATDPDDKVRFQLACSIGEWNTPEAGNTLAALAAAAVRDHREWSAAIMSSANNHYHVLADLVLSSASPVGEPMFGDLITMAIARNDRAVLARLIAPIFGGQHDDEGDRVAALAQLIESLTLRRLSIAKLQQGGSDELTRQLESVPKLFDAARKMAFDANATVAHRAAAVNLLGFPHGAGGHGADDLKALASLLTPKVPPEVQAAAVKSIARTGDAQVPALLTQNWAALSPPTRGAVTDALIAREPWAWELLKQMEAGKLPVQQFDPARRQRLLRHDSERIKTLAAKVLGSGDAAARQKVVQQHMPALSLPADPARGAKVFALTCATCHRLGDVGQEIGPDLRSVSGWEPDALLTSILDPNALVEPRYLSYTVIPNSGETLFGIITAETSDSITLKGLDAKEQTLPRTAIKSMESTNRSLMPDALEATVSDQDLADVIRYIQTTGTGAVK